MMPGVVAGGVRELPVFTAAIPVQGLGWTYGSPAPKATRQGNVVTLSGQFIASNISGSGDQQNAGILPVGFRPHPDKTETFTVMVGSNSTTMTIYGWTGTIQLATWPNTLNGALDLYGITFTTD